MKKNKSLLIIRYNRKLQKRFNLSIIDYREYTQIFTPIEILLKLSSNKYDIFINMNDELKEYYHVYFDNSNTEIKRNYLKK